ncbi:MAG: dUTP diphosphatase [Myxococcales bacterium]|nr:dUTP diphosphatase [Myxococcales bacterium]
MSERTTVLNVQKLRPDAVLPRFATEGAAGMDLAACLDAPIELRPGRWAAIPTGLALAIPPGHEGQVRPRSGLAFKHGVTVLNAPGTLDADYRGEVKVLLINHGDEPFLVEPGMRIAQLVLAAYVVPTLREASSLDASTRGGGGFGSTGV